MPDYHPLPTPGTPPTPPPLRKIAIEEHFADPHNLPTNVDPDFAAKGGLEMGFVEQVIKRMFDISTVRIEEMDAADIDVSVLSLTTPGVEGIRDRQTAVDFARKTNDHLAEIIRDGNGRFAGFASVALQDTDAAIAELDRAHRQLGMNAVMINGSVDIGSDERPHFLDEARFDAFWEATAALETPVYLHPRPVPPPVHATYYHDHPELSGATWGFAPDTATHVLRIVYGGVFDRHPGAQLILGHLGETLPFFYGRIQRAFEYNPFKSRPAKRLQDYLAENIHITTSGNSNDQALITSILTVGADRILFATDYPYDVAPDAARWIESAPIAENDRRKIAYGNAAKLLRLN